MKSQKYADTVSIKDFGAIACLFEIFRVGILGELVTVGAWNAPVNGYLNFYIKEKNYVYKHCP